MPTFQQQLDEIKGILSKSKVGSEIIHTQDLLEGDLPYVYIPSLGKSVAVTRQQFSDWITLQKYLEIEPVTSINDITEAGIYKITDLDIETDVRSIDDNSFINLIDLKGSIEEVIAVVYQEEIPASVKDSFDLKGRESRVVNDIDTMYSLQPVNPNEIVRVSTITGSDHTYDVYYQAKSNGYFESGADTSPPPPMGMILSPNYIHFPSGLGSFQFSDLNIATGSSGFGMIIEDENGMIILYDTVAQSLTVPKPLSEILGDFYLTAYYYTNNELIGSQQFINPLDPNIPLLIQFPNSRLDKKLKINKDYLLTSNIQNVYIPNFTSGVNSIYKVEVDALDAEWDGDYLRILTGNVQISSLSFTEFVNAKAFVTTGMGEIQTPIIIGFADLVNDQGVDNPIGVYVSDDNGNISRSSNASKYQIQFEVAIAVSGDNRAITRQFLTGPNVYLFDIDTTHASQMNAWFDHYHPTFEGVYNSNRTHPIYNSNLRRNANGSAKATGSDMLIEAISSSGGLEELAENIDPDVFLVEAQGDNTTNRIDRTDSETDFKQGVVFIRGGNLGEDAGTVTCSYGFGTEFVEPSRLSDITGDTSAIAGFTSDTLHLQSPATGLASGKLKRIKDTTKVTWNLVRLAARESATKATPMAPWNEFDGFGIIDPDAAILLIEQWKTDFLVENAVDTVAKRLYVDPIIDFDSLNENTAVPKRHIQEILPKNGTFTPSLIDFAGNVTFTQTSQGIYQKTGKVVTFALDVGISGSSGTPSGGDIQITGLPFTSDSTIQQSTTVVQAIDIGVNYYSINGIIPFNENKIIFRLQTALDDSNNTVLITSNLPAGATFVVSGTYITN